MPVPPFLFDPTRWDDWAQWLEDHALQLLLIAVFLLVAEYLFRKVVSRILRRAITRAARARLEDPVAIRRRADTLSATLNWAFGIFLLFLAAGLFLSELGLNIAALIAGVGVVGIAVGLGAQTLVRDVINGMFILIEDQYSVGDFVSVGGVSGEVIEINPRRTVLRDLDGHIHSVPNSAITVATNMTQARTRINLDFEVGYADIGEATRVIDQVCLEVSRERAAQLIDPPKVDRVTSLPNGSVRIKVLGDAREPEQWAVAAELLSRARSALEAAGVTPVSPAPPASVGDAALASQPSAGRDTLSR